MQDVSLLQQALPYIRRFRNTIFVVKFGGEAVRDAEQLDRLAEDISVLHTVGIRVVVVHGGGAQVTEMEKTLGVSSRMVGGRRVTDEGSLNVLKMMLAGRMNLDIVAALKRHGVPAIGLSAAAGNIVDARKRPPTRVSGGGDELIDFGLVGDIHRVHPEPLQLLLGGGYLPVLCPLSADDHGQVLNINADTVASRVAVALKAAKLLLMTATLGVMADLNDRSTLISQLSAEEAREEIRNGLIGGGMIPKVEEALYALEHGVPQVHILSGIEPDQLLLEVFTETGCGTMLVP